MHGRSRRKIRSGSLDEREIDRRNKRLEMGWQGRVRTNSHGNSEKIYSQRSYFTRKPSRIIGRMRVKLSPSPLSSLKPTAVSKSSDYPLPQRRVMKMSRTRSIPVRKGTVNDSLVPPESQTRLRRNSLPNIPRFSHANPSSGRREGKDVTEAGRRYRKNSQGFLKTVSARNKGSHRAKSSRRHAKGGKVSRNDIFGPWVIAYNYLKEKKRKEDLKKLAALNDEYCTEVDSSLGNLLHRARKAGQRDQLLKSKTESLLRAFQRI